MIFSRFCEAWIAPRFGPGDVRIRIAASGINPGDIKKRQDSFASAFHIHASFPIATVPGESIRSATTYLPIGSGGRCGVTARPRRAQPVFPSL